MWGGDRGEEMKMLGGLHLIINRGRTCRRDLRFVTTLSTKNKLKPKVQREMIANRDLACCHKRCTELTFEKVEVDLTSLINTKEFYRSLYYSLYSIYHIFFVSTTIRSTSNALFNDSYSYTSSPMELVGL